METYVRRNRRIYDFSTCLLCGDAYGIAQGEHKAHRPSRCRACGTLQCWTNGLARGQCAVCYVGLLDAFADRTCGYAGCGKQAVAAAPRVRYACKDHLERARLNTSIAEAIANRDTAWQRVEFTFDQFPVLL